MNGLSANIHLMFVPFYRPTPARCLHVCGMLPISSRTVLLSRLPSRFYVSFFSSVHPWSYDRPPAACPPMPHFCSGRFKIIMEAKAFPSDRYIVESQVRFHGYDPSDAVVLVSPRAGNIHTYLHALCMQAYTCAAYAIVMSRSAVCRIRAKQCDVLDTAPCCR